MPEKQDQSDTKWFVDGKEITCPLRESGLALPAPAWRAFLKHFERQVKKRLKDDDEDPEADGDLEVLSGDLPTPMKVRIEKSNGDELAYLVRNVFGVKMAGNYYLLVTADISCRIGNARLIEIKEATLEASLLGRVISRSEDLEDGSIGEWLCSREFLEKLYNGCLEQGDWEEKSAYHRKGRKTEYRVYNSADQTEGFFLLRGEYEDKEVMLRRVMQDSIAYDGAEPLRIKTDSRMLQVVRQYFGYIRSGKTTRCGLFYYHLDPQGGEHLRSRYVVGLKEERPVFLEIGDVRKSFVTGEDITIHCPIEEDSFILPKGTIFGGVWKTGRERLLSHRMEYLEEVRCPFSPGLSERWMKNSSYYEMGDPPFAVADKELVLEFQKDFEKAVLKRMRLPQSIAIADEKSPWDQICSKEKGFGLTLERERGKSFVYSTKTVDFADHDGDKEELSLHMRLKMSGELNDRDPTATDLCYPMPVNLWYLYDRGEAHKVRLILGSQPKISFIPDHAELYGETNGELKRYAALAGENWSRLDYYLEGKWRYPSSWMSWVGRVLFKESWGGMLKIKDRIYLDLLLRAFRFIYADLEKRLSASEIDNTAILKEYPMLQVLPNHLLLKQFDRRNAAMWEDFALIWTSSQQKKKQEKIDYIPNLCLLGEAGTGKTTLARQLAGLYEKDILLCTPADIKGPYVGWTKAAVYNRFKQAQDEDKVLVLDEIYELLGDAFGKEAVTLLLPILSGDNTFLQWADYYESEKDPPQKSLDLKEKPVPVWLCGYEIKTRKMLSDNPGLYRRMRILTLPAPSVSILYQAFRTSLTRKMREYIDARPDLKNSIETWFGWGVAAEHSELFANFAGALKTAEYVNVLSDMPETDGRPMDDMVKEVLERLRQEIIRQRRALITTDSKASFEVNNDVRSTFADVIGYERARNELKNITAMFFRKEEYEKDGIRIPHGALLIGPPGTGKTLLARAMAGQLQKAFAESGNKDIMVSFIPAAATELNSPDKIRALFYQAGLSDFCVVFIDEIDAIGMHRKRGEYSVLIQLLKEMDGFEKRSNVFVLAATNAPQDLDPALIRPGRFDRIIPVELPDVADREKLLKYYLEKKAAWKSITGRLVNEDPNREGLSGEDTSAQKLIGKLASRTYGFSPARLESMVNEAAMLYGAESSDELPEETVRAEGLKRFEVIFQELLDRELIGEKRVSLRKSEAEGAEINENSRIYAVAVHEVGHALVHVLMSEQGNKLSERRPFEQISVEPRGRALGFVSGAGNPFSGDTKAGLVKHIRKYLGGRAAEELILGEEHVNIGAVQDFQSATRIANSMIFEYGMSDEIGPMALVVETGDYLENRVSFACSDALREKAEKEVSRLLKEQYKWVKELLRAHTGLISLLAKELCKKEKMSGEEFLSLYDRYRAEGV